MIYFDNAATTRFKPLCVKSAVIKELSRSANPGRSGHDASIRAATEVEECREIINKVFFDGKVVFTKNCTEALNLAIFGSRPKNQVVTTVTEHNSVLRPLRYLEKTGKIKLTIIRPDKDGYAVPLQKALTIPTSMVIIGGMSNVTGQSNDIATLSKIVKEKSDALFLCDMAQAAGHIKIDFSYVDMAAFAGHKSLHGIQGTGFLIVKNNLTLSPLIMGGTGSYSLSLEHPNDIPEGMEAGTINTPGIAALRRGIEWTYKRFDKVNKKIGRVHKYLCDGFAHVDNLEVIAADNGIILTNVKGMAPSEFADRLNENGICVRAGLHCAPLAHEFLKTLPDGAVRFSAGFNNDISDAERTVEVVEKICHTVIFGRVYW